MGSLKAGRRRYASITGIMFDSPISAGWRCLPSPALGGCYSVSALLLHCAGMFKRAFMPYTGF